MGTFSPASTWSMAAKILHIRTAFHYFISSSKPLTNPNARLHLLSTKAKSPNQSLYRKQISLANLFQRYGFPPFQLHSFISTNHFLSNSNLHDIEKSLGILLSFKIPQQSIVCLIIECPGVLEFEFLKKWEIVISKLRDLSIPPLVIKSVLAHSKRLQIDPDWLNKCVNVLKCLGFSEGTIRKMLEGFPGVITMKKSEIHRRIKFLTHIGIPNDEIDWIFSSYPKALRFGVENRLMPLVDEFENLGFSKKTISKEIIKEPQILGMELGELARCLQFLSSLKCREPIKLKIFMDGAFRAGFVVKLRVDCLCNHGLIRREAFKVLWKEPRVVIYDLEDVEQKIEFLVNTMRFNVGCLVEVPEYLGVSFEKQIVPRYNVIKYLGAKGALGEEVGLKGMINLSRLKFYNLYVKPYPECEKMFGRFSGDVHVKRHHPVGLWELFKPQMKSESKEDVKNMKTFMEGLV